MTAGVVHVEVGFQAEVEGTLDGSTYSYRKSISPQFMGLAGSLAKYAQVHIVEGDESGAFDMPIRCDVARATKTWPGQCDWGTWAAGYYGRQQVQIWTTKGLAQPVVPQLGFSQGCRLAATGYVDLGKYRTRGLRTLSNRWWEGATFFSEVVFSDDRRWFGRSNDEASRVSTVAHLLSQEACAPSNLEKALYTSLYYTKEHAI